MKKNVYFLISAILQILGAALVIINVNTIIQAGLDTASDSYAMLPIETQEKMISMVQNGFMKGLTIIGSIIQIILNIFVIKYVIKDSILKHKGKLIAFSIICFFISETLLLQTLSLCNFIILLCLKRKNPEDFPEKEKKEIPKIEHEKSTIKEKIVGIALILLYFSQLIIDRVIPEDISQTTILIIIVSFYILIFAMSIIIMKDRLKRDIKIFKENRKSYLQYILPRLGIMYIIYTLINLGSMILSEQGTSVNQSMVDALPLWFSIPTAVIWAPIVEEIIFRGVFRKFIKNDIAFIIISGVIFGLLHTLLEQTVLKMIIIALPYSILGAFLAYIYAKTENITSNILVHWFHNTIVMTISVLMILLR